MIENSGLVISKPLVFNNACNERYEGNVTVARMAKTSGQSCDSLSYRPVSYAARRHLASKDAFQRDRPRRRKRGPRKPKLGIPGISPNREE